MADFDYDALSDLTLTLEAEDGSEVNLEMLYILSLIHISEPTRRS